MIKGNAVEAPANPYQSPQIAPDTLPRRASWLRGMFAALVAGTLAAAVMWVAGCLMTAVNDLPPRRNWYVPDFADVARYYGAACFGLFWLFAMAALVTYTPATRQGMVRALLRVGAYALLSGLCLGMIKYAFVPRTYDTEGTAAQILMPVFAGTMIGIGISLARTQIHRDRGVLERERMYNAGG